MKIENGCVRLKGEENSWLYSYTDSEGIHDVVFIAFQTPVIGDFIVGGVLVPKVGLQINPDASRWVKRRKKTWGE